MLAALGAAAAGWSYFVFDCVCRPDMVALVRVWKRECINNETGNKTSELLTIGSEFGTEVASAQAKHGGVASKYRKVVVMRL